MQASSECIQALPPTGSNGIDSVTKERGLIARGN